MICQKFTQCVDYLSDPINGESNCCICCVKLKPINVIKSIAIQDVFISICLILIGINAIVELNIIDYYLKTLSSDTFMYGIVFTASGGIIVICLLIYYLADRKKNLKWLGLFYVVLRTALYLSISVYSALLIICVIDSSTLSDPTYGFDDTTKQKIKDSPGQYYGIVGVIILFSLMNHFFSFILFLCYKFISEGYEYEKAINMQSKEEKQTFAPEWFRSQEVAKKNNNLVVSKDPKAAKGSSKAIKNEDNMTDIEKNKVAETQPTAKKSKFKKNQVVPETPDSDQRRDEDDLRAKSTKAIIPDDLDGRKSQNTMKIINIDNEGSENSFNNLNQY